LQARRRSLRLLLQSLVGTTTSASMTPNNNSTTTSTTMETPKPQALSSSPNNNWTNCSDVIHCNSNAIDEDCSFHGRFPPSLPPIQQLAAAAAAAPNETATPNYKPAYPLQTLLLQQPKEDDEWKRKLAETQASHAKEVKLLNSQQKLTFRLLGEALARSVELQHVFLAAHPNAQGWNFDCICNCKELYKNWQATFAQLDEANAKYTALHAKYTALQNMYVHDTLAWQSLVEGETNSHHQHRHHDEEESLDYSEQENNQEFSKEKDQEFNTSIDDWEKEMGQSSWSSLSSSSTHFGTTANMERVAAEMQQEDHRANGNTTTDSSALDETMVILTNLKESNEKGRSVFEQVEELSEMMQDQEFNTSIDDWEKEMGHSSWSSFSSSNTHFGTTANMERVAAEMQQEDHRANGNTTTDSSTLDETMNCRK
jgi:hypothetical protein